jgi:hypothetical protein
MHIRALFLWRSVFEFLRRTPTWACTNRLWHRKCRKSDFNFLVRARRHLSGTSRKFVKRIVPGRWIITNGPNWLSLQPHGRHFYTPFVGVIWNSLCVKQLYRAYCTYSNRIQSINKWHQPWRHVLWQSVNMDLLFLVLVKGTNLNTLTRDFIPDDRKCSKSQDLVFRGLFDIVFCIRKMYLLTRLFCHTNLNMKWVHL